MKGEISFDLVMDDVMEFVEGAFRLLDQEWQVLIANHRPVTQVEMVPQEWESGVRGVLIKFPVSGIGINRDTILKYLSDFTETIEWEEVRGPDSMQLR